MRKARTENVVAATGGTRRMRHLRGSESRMIQHVRASLERFRPRVLPV
jgi:hypothetical protein